MSRSSLPTMNQYVFVFLVGTMPSLSAAVVYRSNPQTIVAWTPENTISFDFDDNGVEDWRVASFYSNFSTPMVQVDSPVTTSFLYEWSEISSRGVDFEALARGTIIGHGSESGNVRFQTPFVEGASGRLASGFPLPDPTESDRNFLNETAYLGFRFQGEEGLHYGYALFTDTTSRGTTLVATAWESEPDTAIVAGAVPEPSSLILLGLGMMGSCLVRRSWFLPKKIE